MEKYETPLVDLVDVKLEAGFATSVTVIEPGNYENGGEFTNNHIIKFCTGIGVTMQKNLELLPGKIYTINATLPKDYIDVTSIVPEKRRLR